MRDVSRKLWFLPVLLLLAQAISYGAIFAATTPEVDRGTAGHSRFVTLDEYPPHPLKEGKMNDDRVPLPDNSYEFPREPEKGEGPTRRGGRGDYTLLGIRVQFQVDSDPTTTGDGTMEQDHDIGYFNSIFGRVHDYYQEVSYGNFSLEATVTDKVYTLDHEMSYYGSNQNTVENNVNLVKDAVNKADPDIDFTRYGKFIVIHAGSGEEMDVKNDSPNDIWSNHIGAYQIWAVLGHPYIETDEGTRIRDISVVPETHDQDGYTGRNITGVITHEFGHDLGLPDLYDVTYESDGIGFWGLMGSGAHLNGGYTPAHLTAWSKIYLGWVEPKVADENTKKITIRDIETYPDVYKIYVPYTNHKEYFLVVNRERVGFDNYLPRGGLLIWHIDENKLYESVGSGFTRMDANNVNVDPAHKGVDLEEASGTQELDARGDGNGGDGNDPWSNDKEGFSPKSVPNSNDYSDRKTEIHVYDISFASNTMTFSVMVEERGISIEGPSENSSMIEPNATVSFELGLTTNRKNGTDDDWADKISLITDGINEDWLSFEKNPVIIPETNTLVRVYANFAAPASALYLDKAVVSITIISFDGTTFDGFVNLTATVSKVRKFNMAALNDITLLPGPENVENVSVTLNNQGNSEEDFSLDCDLSDISWEYELSEEEFAIGPYSSHIVYLLLSSPADSMAGEECTVTLEFDDDLYDTKSFRTGFNATVLQTYNISVEANPERARVKPGHVIEYDVEIRNHGNGRDNVSLELSDKKSGWRIELAREYSEIAPGGTGKVKITLSPYELASPGEVHTFHVIATSEGGVEAWSEALTVEVEEFYLLDMSVHRYNATFDQDHTFADFNIRLKNMGSIADRYELSVTERPAGFEVDQLNFLADDISINAYSEKTVTLRVTQEEMVEAGTDRLRLRIASKTNATISGSITLNLTVNPRIGSENVYDTKIKNLQVKGKLMLELFVNNTSNTNITVSLTSLVSSPHLRVEVEPDDEVPLDMGEGQRFTLRVTALPNAKAGMRTLRFESKLLDTGESEIIKFRVRVRGGAGESDGGASGRSTWVYVLAAIAVFAVLLAIVLVLVFKRRGKKKGGVGDAAEPEPFFENKRAEVEQIVSGNPGPAVVPKASVTDVGGVAPLTSEGGSGPESTVERASVKVVREIAGSSKGTEGVKRLDAVSEVTGPPDTSTGSVGKDEGSWGGEDSSYQRKVVKRRTVKTLALAKEKDRERSAEGRKGDIDDIFASLEKSESGK